MNNDNVDFLDSLKRTGQQTIDEILGIIPDYLKTYLDTQLEQKKIEAGLEAKPEKPIENRLNFFKTPAGKGILLGLGLLAGFYLYKKVV